MRALLAIAAGAVVAGLVVMFAPPRHERSIYYRTRGRQDL